MLASLGVSRSGVVDWADLETWMPFTGDEISKRKRIKLFREMDADDNGLLHVSESVKILFRRIPSVRGLIDTRHLWMECFRIARTTSNPVVPIGIDFMEQAQFRNFLWCVWIYLRLWECMWKSQPRGAVEVRPNDVQKLVEVLILFGYDDPDGLYAFLMTNFENKDKIPFEEFALICLKKTLSYLTQIDEDYEQDNAKKELNRIQPGLLRKNDQMGRHKVQSLESLEQRMTGFNVRKARNLKADVVKHCDVPGQAHHELKAGEGNHYTSEYAMLYTGTKFHPESRHDPQTARQLYPTQQVRKDYSAVDLHWDSSKRKSLCAAGNTITGSPKAPSFQNRNNRFMPYQPLQKSNSAAAIGAFYPRY